MTPHRKQSETMYSIVTLTALVLCIYFSGHYAYVLFHGLVEVVSIAIAFAMFVLVWNTRAYLTNNYLRLLGIGYAFSAFIDLLHTFSFQGMTVFTGYGANLAPQLWLAARYLQTVTLVAAPLVITRSMNNRVIFGGYAVAVAGLLALVYSGHFPDCIIAGQGLTPFKKNSEYIISGFLVLSLYLLSRKRSHFSDRIYWLLVASVSCTIFSELMFTTFVSMYDVTNKIGHIAKLVAFYLVYRSILVTGFKEPFEVVFSTLKQTEQELRDHQIRLEDLVRERTASLEAEVRKRAEEEFKTLNERFTLATNAAHLGVWDWNIAKNELLWDNGMYTLYGIRREDFSGAYEAWLQGVHPDDRATGNDISERARLGEQEYNTEFRVVWPDGSVHHLRAYGQVVRDQSGTAIRMTGINVDVTAQKLAEDEIRRLKNYLANIIDSMPSQLVGLDRDGVITQWNRRAEEITGIPAIGAIGRPVDLVLPEYAPWIEALRDETGQGRLAVMEKALLERRGERRFYDLMLYPLTANGVQGLVLRIEDVTERVRIQELMIQTEKMMSVGGLAAGMAHEINNPLGIITQAVHNIERRTSLELAANREAAVEAGIDLDALADYFNRRRIPEFIASISEAASRASRIIANMLRFSRRAETTMTAASPAAIMEQALELAANDYDLKKKYDFRSIEIIWEYQAEVPAVPMVATEMEQVLLNLLKNAAQAMKENPAGRKPRLVLRIRREDRYAVIEVEDNGPGMTEDVRHRVFEPFFTTKEPDIGTGLGLSVSYMIVTQNHKGLMELTSSSGNGACFTVRLPLVKGEG